MTKCDHEFNPFDEHHTMCSKCGEIRYVPTEIERQLIGRLLDLEQRIERLTANSPNQGEPADLEPGQSLDEYIDEVEKLLIERALRQARFNKTQAASDLGISFRSLRYKLNKHNLG